jgi:DNA invertase Pin-like site-specific DNA recombinase
MVHTQGTAFMAQHTTRVVGYIRVSTEQQADHGVSLEAQREKIQAYAKLYDLELIDIVVDAGASAKTLDRDGLQHALSLLTSGQADALLVTKLDRLTRKVKDLGTLIEEYFERYALMSVSDQIDTRTANGRLVLNILTSISQWEREAIGERTKDALQHKKHQGQRISGRLPYGSRLAADGSTLVEDAAEQLVIVAARGYAEAGLSLREIAARLAADGHLSRTGQPFQPKAIQAMLRTAA